MTALQAVDITGDHGDRQLGLVPSATLLDAILATGLISGRADHPARVAYRAAELLVGPFMALVADAAAGTTLPAGPRSVSALPNCFAAGTITVQQVPLASTSPSWRRARGHRPCPLRRHGGARGAGCRSEFGCGSAANVHADRWRDCQPDPAPVQLNGQSARTASPCGALARGGSSGSMPTRPAFLAASIRRPGFRRRWGVGKGWLRLSTREH